jgi:hypothetical protein
VGAQAPAHLFKSQDPPAEIGWGILLLKLLRPRRLLLGNAFVFLPNAKSHNVCVDSPPLPPVKGMLA